MPGGFPSAITSAWPSMSRHIGSTTVILTGTSTWCVRMPAITALFVECKLLLVVAKDSGTAMSSYWRMFSKCTSRPALYALMSLCRMFLSTLIVSCLPLQVCTTSYREENVFALFLWIGYFRFKCWSLPGGSHGRLATKTSICSCPNSSAPRRESWISGVTKSLFIMFFNVSGPSWNMPCCYNDTIILPSWESSRSIRGFEHSLCVLIIFAIWHEFQHCCCLRTYDVSQVKWQCP